MIATEPLWINFVKHCGYEFCDAKKFMVYWHMHNVSDNCNLFSITLACYVLYASSIDDGVGYCIAQPCYIFNAILLCLAIPIE